MITNQFLMEPSLADGKTTKIQNSPDASDATWSQIMHCCEWFQRSLDMQRRHRLMSESAVRRQTFKILKDVKIFEERAKSILLV